MKKKIALAMIAYKASKTLEDFYKTLPRHVFDFIILVDDASGDGTYELAQKLGIEAYENPVNLGYGGNMMRALSIALEKGADVIVDLHPDGEYKPSAIPAALAKVEEGAALVLGNRFSSARAPLDSGMFVWKYPLIRLMNWVARVGIGIPCHDVHQGFRVYTRTLLEKIPYQNNSKDYLFSFEIIAQAAFAGLPMAEVSVETNYRGEKRGASLRKSISYSLGVFKVLGAYHMARIGIGRSRFLV